MNAKALLCALVGTLGGFVANLVGGFSEDVLTLMLFMAIDYITGLIVAGVFRASPKSKSGAIQSQVGWKGLCKKGVTLLFVIVAHRLDTAIGCNYIRTATVIGFSTNEAISIIENAGLMGMIIPEPISKAIDVLKGKEDK